MPLAAPSKTQRKKTPAKSDFGPTKTPLYGAEEINAYITIRDQLLDEAEKSRTASKLDSVIVANNFVAGCLQLARSPYEAQCLPEAIAQRERKRCDAVSNRVIILRAGSA